MKHIRIISPSGVIEPEYILLAVQRLEGWGFIVSVGSHALAVNGRFAGTVDERLDDLNEAFADASVDIILWIRLCYLLVLNRSGHWLWAFLISRCYMR